MTRPHPTKQCKRGHDLTGDNLYLRANGTRYCLACQYELDDRKTVIKAVRVRPIKSHCAKGHEMAPDNVTVGKDGSRRCKTCRRLSRSEKTTDENRAKRRAEYFKRNYTTGKMVGTIRGANISSRPSDDLIAEARVRAAAPPRDLTALLLGDPPKGYSMLDRRQSA